jgi:hypothetical protein
MWQIPNFFPSKSGDFGDLFFSTKKLLVSCRTGFVFVTLVTKIFANMKKRTIGGEESQTQHPCFVFSTKFSHLGD